MKLASLPLLLVVSTWISAPASAQLFTSNTIDVPPAPDNLQSTENIDFADVDRDGDWDVMIADGGDPGSAQNRIWINMGGLQTAVTGHFRDRTAERLPAVIDQSRDIDFADLDGDADEDVHITNSSAISNQASRFWINLGGDQGGTIAYFADETEERWVGLGGPGSSVSPAVVLPGGGFADWSCDADFADLDNDGDLDLVHASYGDAVSGDTPTRIFLNDGAGYFEEFNPSGYQPPGTTLPDNAPGLWCDGQQVQHTMDTTGTFCDIATTALDVDLADIDGDFDIDILHGGKLEAPRMFANRLDGSSLAPATAGGGLGFRDVTYEVYPPNYHTARNYAQEMGDFDGDGDLDIYGVNWSQVFDATFENDGTGRFSNMLLFNDNVIDTEADVIDFDNDGDLDVVVASFDGSDRMYVNNTGGGGFSFMDGTAGVLPLNPHEALDGEVADIDNDGDYDVMIGNTEFSPNLYLVNQHGGSDVFAPYIPAVEQASDRTCGPEPTVVRAHVYDNAPHYITWYNRTWVAVEVNGGPTLTFPAKSSYGQVFRAEIPGELAGTIEYRFVSEDQYGNAGTSAQLSYTATDAGCAGPIRYCDPAGPNSVRPSGASLDYVAGQPGGLLTFEISGAPAGQFGLLYFGPDAADLPFGCGRRCVGGMTVRSLPYSIQAGSFQVDWDTTPPPVVPSPFHVQFWYRDPANLAACGGSFNLSNALQL